MATDMISSMTQRVLFKLENELKNLKVTCECKIPITACVMINVISECQKVCVISINVLDI